MPIQARGWWVEKGLAMGALPFVRHSTMALAPMVTQASSLKLSSLWSSLLQEMLLHSQQLSPPWVCAPKPLSSTLAPFHNKRCMTPVGVHCSVVQTMHIALTLSCILQTFCRRSPLIFQRSLSAPADYPTVRAFFSLPAVSHLALSDFFSFFLSSYLAARGFFLSF